MNSYNENLQNSVLASLQSQDLEQKNLNAQYNASKFTLYFAEGATITAKSKLKDAKSDLKAKAWVKEQAMHTNNIANNLLSSATQANTYLGQSISNTAVCAANVQIAANAIKRLASDVGSIFSIVNAADYETDIFSMTKEVKELIDGTAYDAEYTSQLAMDSSTYASEVSSATVLDNTKTSGAQMSNITQIASAGYDAAAQVVMADNAIFGAAISTEKNAEGNIKGVGIGYDTAKIAYKCLNEELNLSLRVEPVEPVPNEKKGANTSFIVKFDPIKNPFSTEKYDAGNPIENYYIILVKESRKTIFTLSEAESIALNSDNIQQFAMMSGAEAVKTKSKTINYLKFVKNITKKATEVPDPNQAPQPNQATEVNQTPEASEATEANKDPEMLQMVDSDGDNIEPGVNYVVFLLAEPTNDYKRKINNFDDFLSAPSQAFCMTNKLSVAQGVKFGPIKSDEEDKAYQVQFKTEFDNMVRSNIRIVAPTDPSAGSNGMYSHQLTFEIEEKAPDVAYRCMLLQASELEPGLFTASSFKAFFDREQALRDEANIAEPKIAKKQNEMAQITLVMEQSGDMAHLQVELDTLDNEIKKIQKGLDEDPNNEKSNLSHPPGFFFDLTLAEQVSSGNYMPAVLCNPDKAGDKRKKYVAYIGPDTTDNFGNILVKGRYYIPVVLSTSTVSEENQAKYANALSDFEKTESTPY